MHFLFSVNYEKVKKNYIIKVQLSSDKRSGFFRTFILFHQYFYVVVTHLVFSEGVYFLQQLLPTGSPEGPQGSATLMLRLRSAYRKSTKNVVCDKNIDEIR